MLHDLSLILGQVQFQLKMSEASENYSAPPKNPAEMRPDDEPPSLTRMTNVTIHPTNLVKQRTKG
jgi:hypothetical protein